MNSIINLNYRGNNVPVKLIEGEPWVNLNAVGRPFGKEPKEWLKNNSTNEYLEALSLLNNQGENSPLGENESKTTISVQHGGKNPGTWAVELAALEFARWCDPAFAIWCNRQLRELVTKGEHKVDMKAESLRLKWDQTLVMVKQGKKWGGRFQDFLLECEKPDGERDPRTRYSDMITRFFSAFNGESYDFKKDVIHKMRDNFKTYKEEFLRRSKSKTIAMDTILLIDVEVELENLWARYEAHSRGQLMRHSKKKNEIVWLNVQDDGIPILNDNEIF